MQAAFHRRPGRVPHRLREPPGGRHRERGAATMELRLPYRDALARALPVGSCAFGWCPAQGVLRTPQDGTVDEDEREATPNKPVPADEKAQPNGSHAVQNHR